MGRRYLRENNRLTEKEAILDELDALSEHLAYQCYDELGHGDDQIEVEEDGTKVAWNSFETRIDFLENQKLKEYFEKDKIYEFRVFMSSVIDAYDEIGDVEVLINDELVTSKGYFWDDIAKSIYNYFLKDMEENGFFKTLKESRSKIVRGKRRMVKESKRIGNRRMIRESEEDFIYEDDIDELIWEIAGEAAQRLKESFVDMMEDGEYVEEDEDGNKRMFEQIHISAITYYNNKIPQVLNDLLVDIGLAYINVDFVAYEDDERTGNAIIWNTDEGGMSPELSYQIEEEIDYTSIGSLERVFYDFINDLLFKEDDKEHIFQILMPREGFEESRKCKKVARSLKEAKMKKLIRARKH